MIFWRKIVIFHTKYPNNVRKSGRGRTLKNGAERREARTLLGYFVWKITILRQKIIFFMSRTFWLWNRSTTTVTSNKLLILVIISVWTFKGDVTVPTKIGKDKIFFGVKSWFFTRNTQKMFAPPSRIGKNMICWCKIVIFHTKDPQNVRASLRSAQIF
jgi:hypothetical protein